MREAVGAVAQGERAVAQEPGRAEVPGARGRERGEDRVAAVHRAEAAAVVRRPVGHCARVGRQEGRAVGRPPPRIAAVAEDGDEPHAGPHPLGQPAPGGAPGERRIVQQHDVVATEHVGGDGRQLAHVGLEGRAVAERERAAEVEAPPGRRARGRDHEQAKCLVAREREVIGVVRRQGIGCEADDGAGHAGRERRRREAHGGRAVRGNVGARRLDDAALQLEGDRPRAQRFRTAVDYPGEDGHALPVPLPLAGQLHAGDQCVGRGRIREIDQSHRGVRRQPALLAPVPREALQVAHDHHLAPGPLRGRKHLARGGERRPEAGGAVAGRERAHRGSEGARRRFRPAERRRPVVERHHRRVIGRAEPCERRPDCVLRACPAGPVPHAVGPVEQDDQLARGAGARGERRIPVEKWPRERGGEQHERQAAKGQQHRMANRLAADLPVLDPLEEHEGGEGNDPLPLLVEQVQEHRHRERREADQEGGNQEPDAHQRTRASRWRLLR